MLKRLLPLAAFQFVLAVHCLSAQDSLVSYRDLKFNSEFEKTAFNGYIKKNDKSQLLPLLLSVSAAASDQELNNIKNRINGIHDYLSSEGIDKKKPEKKVKAVYDHVHTTLLKKYELENRFLEIFTSGNYNCVTATALYALVMESLSIPYEVKEEPTHVYLLAYPNANNIVVETTTPLFGFLTFDDRYKQNFVNNLKSQKIIGSSEIQQKSLEELFNTYYFKNEKIDLKKLVGIHYINDALFKNDHQMVREAYEQAQKAYFLYPSPRCEFLILNFGVTLIGESKIDSKEKAKLIGQISRLNGHGITDDMIKGEFSNLTQDILFRQNNKTLYQDCYRILRANLGSKELMSEIDYMYNYEYGRVYYNQGNYTMANKFFQNALKIQPNNVDLCAIFVAVIGQNFKNDKNNRSILDSLTSYQGKFPGLLENNNFSMMLAMATVLQFGEEYTKGRPAAGDQYKARFESMIQNNRNIVVPSNAIGNAYSAACTYYFKKGQKAKAKEFLNKGLQLAPDSYELRSRQQMIN